MSNAEKTSDDRDPFGLRLIAQHCRAKVAGELSETDLLVTFDPIHVGYLTGYRSLQLDTHSSMQTAAVICGDHITLITGAADAVAASEFLPPGSNIIGYGQFFTHSDSDSHDKPATIEWFDNFRQALAEVLIQFGKQRQTWGIDSGNSDYNLAFMRSQATAKVVDVSNSIRRSRATKLPSEIEHLSKGAKFVELGIERAALAANGHTTEWDLASEVAQTVFAAGGVPRSLVVASGERSACADVRPSQRVIREGDILRFDVSACFGGYWVDLARTFILGTATREQRETYNAIKSGLDAEMACLRPGITAEKMFQSAVHTVRTAGLPLYRRHHCGHGVGVMPMETPIISDEEGTTIEAHMVLSLETPYYRPGWGGMSVEEMVTVTDTGYIRLSEATRPLELC